MTVFDRIQDLAKKRGLNVTTVATDLGFSQNLFYQWKTSKPSSVRLQKVADYFGVSSEYLLTGKEEENNEDSMAKQVMMRMDTTGLSNDELKDLESEMERFFAWRIEEIKREREE
ncbi:helix-turn-helix transcriptional regulator [Vagococcus carniphilus]|uniref:helix-turn-helix domain-containing protein n=1 Tax=Vagococcus carniphilus TaxID=218144 RepID=UPI0028908AF0|nr:helix-turn-helix transcriptional regulator [Vagococcus carniphilus]MDT2849028.1 helix-turn-helix transcriptional regulator [Vagococcus carniphilus]